MGLKRLKISPNSAVASQVNRRANGDNISLKVILTLFEQFFNFYSLFFFSLFNFFVNGLKPAVLTERTRVCVEVTVIGHLNDGVILITTKFGNPKEV